MCYICPLNLANNFLESCELKQNKRKSDKTLFWNFSVFSQEYVYQFF